MTTKIPCDELLTVKSNADAEALCAMMSGEDNPFVMKDGVQRYQTVLIECAEAEKARLIEGQDVPSKE